MCFHGRMLPAAAFESFVTAVFKPRNDYELFYASKSSSQPKMVLHMCPQNCYMTKMVSDNIIYNVSLCLKPEHVHDQVVNASD
jgi:hypothetical protein